MMRRAAIRRGPGLVGTVARTAVIAGTATAVSGHMVDKRNQTAAAPQQEINESQQVADMQAQLDAMQAQQAQQAMAPAAAPAYAAPAAGARAGGGGLGGQLQPLGTPQ